MTNTSKAETVDAVHTNSESASHIASDRASHAAHTVSQQRSQRAFYGMSALVCAAGAAATVVWCASMSAMGEMTMAGGWTLSMAWMRMPGQTWLDAAASFLGMWVLMMSAMMLPSLAPQLWRYRRAVGVADNALPGYVTAGAVAGGYFLVWTVFGAVIFLLGTALAAIEMQFPEVARAVPIAVGVVILLTGALQFTAWKSHHLACCRTMTPHACASRPPCTTGRAWRYGLRLGVHCCYCCAGLTGVLLCLGMMNLRAMAVVTAATTLERLAPGSQRIARAIGVALIGLGLFLIARATDLG